jgi:hypothetical protein
VDGVFVNNRLENITYTEGYSFKDAVYPSGNGFFFEISKGAICAGNVFVNCDHGVLVLNSSNVQIVQNTFVNSQAAIGRNARTAAGDHFDWHPSTGPGVEERAGHVFKNNLLVADKTFKEPLLFVWQPADLCKRVKTMQLQQLDYNTYVRAAEAASAPLMLWSPTENEDCRSFLNSLADLQKLNAGFSANSRDIAGYSGSLFKSPELGDYQLLPASPASGTATEIPAEIRKMLGQSAKGRYTGAYPPVK